MAAASMVVKTSPTYQGVDIVEVLGIGFSVVPPRPVFVRPIYSGPSHTPFGVYVLRVSLGNRETSILIFLVLLLSR